jgi:hypothetical protein
MAKRTYLVGVCGYPDGEVRGGDFAGDSELEAAARCVRFLEAGVDGVPPNARVAACSPCEATVETFAIREVREWLESNGHSIDGERPIVTGGAVSFTGVAPFT